MRPFGRISLILLSTAAFGQTVGTPSTFDIADVQVSPRSDWVKKGANQMQGGVLNAGRYELRRATMLDLIKVAYSVDAEKVFGGPSWLDYDRFVVTAKAPPATRPAALKSMLQSLLADRFGLVVKKENKPVPGYVLSAGKVQPKLKPAESSDSGGCQRLPTVRGDVPTATIQCRGATMEEFASTLRELSFQFLESLPVVDATGIEGRWDFDLKYAVFVTSLTGKAAANSGTTATFVEAVEKQLGLKLERGTASQPVLVVESVNETPSANPPGVAAALPPLPPPEFEVASIRPCDGKGPNPPPRFEPSGRYTAHCVFFLANAIRQALDFTGPELAGAPKWLFDQSSPGFSIEAKAPPGNYVDWQGRPDRFALDAMVRALLVKRFQMKFHYEDRLVDAETLVAVKPKLTKADPSGRTGCTRQRGSPTGGDGPDRLVCQNITMAQFAEQLEGYGQQILYPVLDATGIKGAWDFTLNYDLFAGLALPPIFAGRGAAAGDASEPSGGVSFAGAIERQLGLKLEKRKRTLSVLVLDHIEQNPTEN